MIAVRCRVQDMKRPDEQYHVVVCGECKAPCYSKGTAEAELVSFGELTGANRYRNPYRCTRCFYAGNPVALDAVMTSMTEDAPPTVTTPAPA